VYARESSTRAAYNQAYDKKVLPANLFKIARKDQNDQGSAISSVRGKKRLKKDFISCSGLRKVKIVNWVN